jgi:hypothetical protein
MFENGGVTVEENGSTGKKSASDQTIIIRRFGMPVDVEIAGKKFTIKPGSYFLNNLLEHMVDEYRASTKDVIAKVYKNAEMEKSEFKNDEEKTEILGMALQEMLTDYKSILQDSKKPMFKAVQIILLDSKNPNWKFDKDFPYDAELESVITVKELERIASIEEINIILDAYNQLNKPELPRQNFLKLGAVM